MRYKFVAVVSFTSGGPASHMQTTSQSTPRICSDSRASWRNASASRPRLGIGLKPCASSDVCAIARLTSSAARLASARCGEPASPSLSPSAANNSFTPIRSCARPSCRSCPIRVRSRSLLAITSRSSSMRSVKSRTVTTTSSSPLLTKRASTCRGLPHGESREPVPLVLAHELGLEHVAHVTTDEVVRRDGQVGVDARVRRMRVEIGAVACEPQDEVGVCVEKSADPALGFAQRLLGSLAFGDVDVHVDQAAHLTRGIEQL